MMAGNFAMPEDDLLTLAQLLGVEPWQLAFAFGTYTGFLREQGLLSVEASPVIPWSGSISEALRAGIENEQQRLREGHALATDAADKAAEAVGAMAVKVSATIVLRQRRLRAVVEAARTYRRVRDDDSTDARGDDDLALEEATRDALYEALDALDVSGTMGGSEPRRAEDIMADAFQRVRAEISEEAGRQGEAEDDDA